jgi:GNAT superfamily N-acetyltransferase
MSRLKRFLHDVRTLPADAWLAYQREGVRGVWKSVAARSLHRVFRAGHVAVLVYSLEPEQEAALPAGVTITSATDHDWTALGGLVGQRELSEFRHLHAGGHRCLIAWRGREPVGYAWVADHPGPDVTIWPLSFEFPGSAAYLCKLYVLPSERGHGIGPALTRAQIRVAWESGFREGWGMVATSNRASLRSIQKSSSGARVVGEVRFLQLLDRTYARFFPADPLIQ